MCRDDSRAEGAARLTLCPGVRAEPGLEIEGADEVRMTLSLAFVSSVLAEAAMEGRLPRGFCVKRLTDLPMLWSEQWRAIGLQTPTQVRAELS